ncbi:xylulokinase [Kistimonas asteriae]|uniref:xylulokinase n=1 Tax=Kistimonas asteriae TaxID=517724 RepID=UPI001BACC013|nr:xylulokinase [Kistimonas asteriae]
MFLGIDLGTSGVKTVLLSDTDAIIGQASAPLTVSHPHPLWSEQHPDDWWQAVCTSIENLRRQHDLSGVKAIGLSGQMHGATVLDDDLRPLRPAILWNDGRSHAECLELEERVPELRTITGNQAMPGFTAPKLRWLRKHEPEVFSRIHKVLLPKDYIRLQLTGCCMSDLSDSAGTLWLDVAKRQWSETMLTSCGLTLEHMPELREGSQIAGYLKPDVAQQWGMNPVPVAAGGGDNAAGAIGTGVTEPGQGILSLGTSGVIFVVSDDYRSNPANGVHSFCHALPDRWHLMSVMLSAAGCLDWLARLTGATDVPTLLAEAEQAQPQESLYFLPYLNGERTPHNNPTASGVFFGMTGATTRAQLTLAVLEGVAMGLNDGLEALNATGIAINEMTLIGGGARSPLWRQILANTLNMPLSYRRGGEVGPALGAARLARLACHDDNTSHIAGVCPVPALLERMEPNAEEACRCQLRQDKFRRLYLALEAEFPNS